MSCKIDVKTFVADNLEAESILENFICLYCYGVAVDPVRCDRCETVYCKACLPESALDPTKFKKKNYYDKSYECFAKCGSRKVVELGKIEMAILNSLRFSCQHADDGCEAELSYADYKNHLMTDCIMAPKKEEPEEADLLGLANLEDTAADEKA